MCDARTRESGMEIQMCCEKTCRKPVDADAEVEIKGLKSKPELNGRRATAGCLELLGGSLLLHLRAMGE